MSIEVSGLDSEYLEWGNVLIGEEDEKSLQLCLFFIKYMIYHKVLLNLGKLEGKFLRWMKISLGITKVT